jgi:hypothetical protein
MCVSGHCAPHSRFSYAIVWGTYDMWMSRGSRAWSQWGVVRRFHVLLACRKFWFSNIRSKEAEERLLRLQQLFSSPASSVDSPIYILRYLSITFATDPAKTKTIQGSADDKAPLRKRFFRQIAMLNATHLTMLEVTLKGPGVEEWLRRCQGCRGISNGSRSLIGRRLP